MENKKNVYIKKNDNKRLIVKCMVGCPLHLRISKRSENQFWQIVSFVDDHSCHRTSRNKQGKRERLAKKIVTTLQHTLEIKPKELIDEAIERWSVNLPHDQAYSS